MKKEEKSIWEKIYDDNSREIRRLSEYNHSLAADIIKQKFGISEGLVIQETDSRKRKFIITSFRREAPFDRMPVVFGALIKADGTTSDKITKRFYNGDFTVVKCQE